MWYNIFFCLSDRILFRSGTAKIRPRAINIISTVGPFKVVKVNKPIYNQEKFSYILIILIIHKKALNKFYKFVPKFVFLH